VLLKILDENIFIIQIITIVLTMKISIILIYRQINEVLVKVIFNNHIPKRVYLEFLRLVSTCLRGGKWLRFIYHFVEMKQRSKLQSFIQ